MALVRIDDLSSITEIAPSHAVVTDILLHAWLNAMVVADDTSYVADGIDRNVQSLVASFRGTDAVTLLEFLGRLLRQASSEVSTTLYKSHDVNYFTNIACFRSSQQIPSGSAQSSAIFEIS